MKTLQGAVFMYACSPDATHGFNQGSYLSLIGTGLPYHIVAAMELNDVANEVYKHNFPESNLMQRNIEVSFYAYILYGMHSYACCIVILKKMAAVRAILLLSKMIFTQRIRVHAY